MRNYLSGLLIIFTFHLFPQGADYINPITTAVPFMAIPTNARIGAFGEIGVVSSSFYPDAGLYQNPALLATGKRYVGGNLSYESWAPEFMTGVYFTGLSGYFAISKSNVVSYHSTYYVYDEIQYTDQYGNLIGSSRRNEFYQQLNYAHLFKNGISAGGGIKYIRSDLGLESVQGADIRPANSIAVDLGIDYRKGFHVFKNSIVNLSAGACINNFGSKIKYSDDSEGDFLPTYLRIGIMVNPDFYLSDDFRLNLDLAYQMEKLLVPTPPVYKHDSSDNLVPIPGSDQFEIEKGKDPDISIFRALYQSFYDAPYGSQEEVHEIVHKFGGELRFSYQQKAYLALRAGKYIAHESKGGTDLTTWGAGIGVFGFVLDYKKILSANAITNGTWALTFGFRTTLTKPAFRF